MRVASLLSFLLLASCTSEPEKLTIKDGDIVKVTDVIKGDEVTVERDKKVARVRLLGIQAFSAVISDPQLSALSAGSVAAATDVIKGHNVKLTFDRTPQDPSGRYLAYIDLDGVDVNAKLLEDGWAVVYTEFPCAREAAYMAVEQKAREASKNLWGLKPAADLVRGLRKQWAEARLQNGGAPVADPLAAAPQ